MIIFASSPKAAVKVFKKYGLRAKIRQEYEDGSILFNII
jgi:hypothetical protein